MRPRRDKRRSYNSISVPQFPATSQTFTPYNPAFWLRSQGLWRPGGQESARFVFAHARSRDGRHQVWCDLDTLTSLTGQIPKNSGRYGPKQSSVRHFWPCVELDQAGAAFFDLDSRVIVP